MLGVQACRQGVDRAPTYQPNDPTLTVQQESSRREDEMAACGSAGIVPVPCTYEYCMYVRCTRDHFYRLLDCGQDGVFQSSISILNISLLDDFLKDLLPRPPSFLQCLFLFRCTRINKPRRAATATSFTCNHTPSLGVRFGHWGCICG